MSLYNIMSTGTSFDSWLTTDSEAERYAAAEDIIEERAKDLLRDNSDYDHTLFENWVEDINSATIEEANSIEEYLRSKDFEKLGRLLWCISVKSREEHAAIQAKLDWENGKLDE